MFAKCWFSVSASTGYIVSVGLDFPVACLTACQTSLPPRPTDESLAAFVLVILRLIWAVIESASCVLPRCINLFLSLNSDLMCGVMNLGSQLDNVIPEQFTAIGPPSFIWRGRGGGGEEQKKLWWNTFQRLRPEEFSSRDSAGDFGLRSFLWPEIYCEGPLYEYEYEYGYEYWFTDF